MANFCGLCGRPLSPGEKCNCSLKGQQQAGYQNLEGKGYSQAGGVHSQSPAGYQQPPAGYSQPPAGYPQTNRNVPPSGNEGYAQNNRAGYQQGMGYQQQGYGSPYQQMDPNINKIWMEQKKEAIKSHTKSIFSEMGPLLKSPISRVKELAEMGNSSVGVEFIFTKTVFAIVMYLICLISIQMKIGNYYGGGGKLPYFTGILFLLLIFAGMDFTKAALLKGITYVFRGSVPYSQMLTITGARAYFETMISAGVFLFIFLGILVESPVCFIIALGFFGLTSFLPIAVEAFSYFKIANCSDNAKPYVYVIVTLLSSLCSGIVGSIFLTSLSNYRNLLSMFY